MIRVSSWQRTGVAMQPARIANILRIWSSRVEMSLYQGGPSCQTYGMELPLKVSGVVPLSRALDDEPDILHLHHVYVSERELQNVVSRIPPKTRIVITVHGEPDRSSLPNRPSFGDILNRVSKFVVVDPGLLQQIERLAPGKGVFIPNHPGRDLANLGTPPLEEVREYRKAALEEARRNKIRKVTGHEPVTMVEAAPDRSPFVLFSPHSLVGRFKNYSQREAVTLELLTAGDSWVTSFFDQLVPNVVLLRNLVLSEAVWVQLQGYLDLLTYEAFSLRCLPVVLRPTREYLEALEGVVGSVPDLPFRSSDPKEIAKVLLNRDLWEPTVESNLRWMQEEWTEGHCAELWEGLYEEVAAS